MSDQTTNVADANKLTIAFWNIEHAAFGQNRRRCVQEIIKLIVSTCNPDFFGIAECEKRESTTNESLGLSLDGYCSCQTHTPNARRHSDALALFWRSSLVLENLVPHDTYPCLRFQYVSDGNHALTIDFFHIPSVIEESVRSHYLTCIGNQFFAIGDWNKGGEFKDYPFGCPNNTDIIHPKSKMVCHYNRTIDYESTNGTPNLSLDNQPPKTNPQNRYTTIKKTKPYNGQYDPGTWNDVFFLKHPSIERIDLTHFHFSDSLIKQHAFGKKGGNSQCSVAPSNHLPIMVEISFSNQMNTSAMTKELYGLL